MRRKYFILLALCFTITSLKAQQISPSDLIQLFKYWQINDRHADKNVFDYLQTLDKNWLLRAKPKVDQNGFVAYYGYTQDQKTWYLPDEYKIMVSQLSPTYNKTILYTFASPNTWEDYKKQMDKMGASKVGSGPSGGGQQTMYVINDWVFALVEFPPGINGPDRTYQVGVFKAK